MTGAYRQTIAKPELIAGYGLALSRAQAGLARLVTEAKAGGLHPLTIAEESADLAPARELANRIRGEAEHVVLLAVGGSSLGAQAIAQLKGFSTPAAVLPAPGPRLHVLDNLDGATMSALLDALPLARTRFLSISKSGTTAETLMQTLAVINALKIRGLGAQTGKLIAVVTEPKDSPLARLAAAHGMTRLPHPTDIGGRFSVLSLVGLLPALVMGLDAARLRAGAAEVWRGLRDGKETGVVEGAAFSVAAREGAGRVIQVMMPYADRLERFALWYRQLWAESLGKDGKGTLPVRALGPVDQHSQLQLYLGGPPNAAFTVMRLAQDGIGPEVPRSASGDPSLAYLEGKRIGDLVMAEARATYETLVEAGHPCRLMELARLDEEALGVLFMHFMIETILAAYMIDVDPFNQPAVEHGKVLARQFMNELKR